MTWTLVGASVLLAAALPVLAAGEPELEIRIIYDNTQAEPGFPSDWGFAALVTFRGRQILFDSGAKPKLFLENLRKFGVDPSEISHAVFSHYHGDHTNGIFELYPFNRSMKVYFLDAFPTELFEKASAVGMKPIRVTEPVQVVPGVFTTGAVRGRISEQALVVETAKGLVMVTGCSHPGIVKLVETAERQHGKGSVRLLVGGFHMHRQSSEQVRAQIERLKELKVERVVPSHCAGEQAIQMFLAEFGERAETGGAGKSITLP